MKPKKKKSPTKRKAKQPEFAKTWKYFEHTYKLQRVFSGKKFAKRAEDFRNKLRLMGYETIVNIRGNSIGVYGVKTPFGKEKAELAKDYLGGVPDNMTYKDGTYKLHGVYKGWPNSRRRLHGFSNKEEADKMGRELKRLGYSFRIKRVKNEFGAMVYAPYVFGNLTDTYLETSPVSLWPRRRKK